VSNSPSKFLSLIIFDSKFCTALFLTISDHFSLIK
jgi:hypothetical protein